MYCVHSFESGIVRYFDTYAEAAVFVASSNEAMYIEHR